MQELPKPNCFFCCFTSNDVFNLYIECVMHPYLMLRHTTTPPFRLNTDPNMDFLESLSVCKLELVYTVRIKFFAPSNYWAVRFWVYTDFEWSWIFLPTKAERWCPRLSFLVSSQNAEERANVPRKRWMDLQRCRRPRKFTSNCWVDQYWVILKFLAHKSRMVMHQTQFFGFVPKRRRKGQCA